MENNKVTVQSQEWRTEDKEGNEVFGETLFINGNPVNKEGREETTVVSVALDVLNALGAEVEMLPDLEPLEVGV